MSTDSPTFFAVPTKSLPVCLFIVLCTQYGIYMYIIKVLILIVSMFVCLTAVPSAQAHGPTEVNYGQETATNVEPQSHRMSDVNFNVVF